MAIQPKKSKRPAGAVGITSDEQEVGTGLLNDVDVEVTAAEWAMWNYGNDAQDDQPFLHLSVQADGAEEATELYLSAGRADRLIPSDDGEWMVPSEGSSAKGLSSSCNAAAFLQSLENAGYDKDTLGSEPISQLVGLYFHLLRVPQPKRSGLPAAEGERERTMPTCSEIHSLPGEPRPKKKGLAAAKSAVPQKQIKTKKKEPADVEDADESDDEDEDEDEDEIQAKPGNGGAGGGVEKEAQQLLLGLLKTPEYKRKGIPKGKVFQIAFQALKDNPKKKKILAVMQQEDFIADGPWDASGDAITPA